MLFLFFRPHKGQANKQTNEQRRAGASVCVFACVGGGEEGSAGEEAPSKAKKHTRRRRRSEPELDQTNTQSDKSGAQSRTHERVGPQRRKPTTSLLARLSRSKRGQEVGSKGGVGIGV